MSRTATEEQIIHDHDELFAALRARLAHEDLASLLAHVDSYVAAGARAAEARDESDTVMIGLAELGLLHLIRIVHFSKDAEDDTTAH